MLDQLLALHWPRAKAGDQKAADRVIKILALKRAYLAGEQKPADEQWKL